MELKMMDLPHYLESSGGGSNVKLIGVLVGEVTPPEPFNSMGVATNRDTFAAVDLVGLSSLTGLYYVKGRVLVVVQKQILEKAKMKKSGRLALELTGAPVKLSSLHGGIDHFVSMMRWVKGDFNSWRLMSVEANPLTPKDYPEFFKVIVNAFKQGWEYTYPVEVPNGYIEACEGYDFEFLDPTLLKEKRTTKQELPEHLQPPTQSLPSNALMGVGNVNLGSSTDSEMGVLLENRLNTHQGVSKKSRFQVKNRKKLAPKTEEAYHLDDLIRESDGKVQEIVQNLIELVQEDNHSHQDEIRKTALALKHSWGNRQGDYTGRALFKEALESILEGYDAKGITGETAIGDTINILNTQIVDNWVDLEGSMDTNKLLEDIYANRWKIYFRIIELILGIRGKLVDCYEQCIKMDISILTLLKDNPYNLCFIDPRISIEDLDKLAMLYGVDLEDKEVKRIRNIAYMHNFMLDSNNMVVGDNTTVRYSDLLYKVKSGFIFSSRNVEILKIEGYILPKARLVSLQHYIKPDLDFNSFKLPTSGWKKVGYKFLLESKDSTEKLLKDYIDSGLGIKIHLDGVSWVSDYVFAKKEMYIYNRLRELCTYNQIKIPDKDIEQCIQSFEKMKAKELGIPDYKLEQRQAEAVYLINNRVACLTGPAGSGKTTTAEALLYAIEMLIGVDPENVMFCAPTGKAANRLKEVVRRKTKTINSLFSIGGDGVGLLNTEYVRQREEIEVLIVDESSMPNINLMYEMVMRIATGTYVFFLGDIQQLPPIGFGKPFANMMSFLPTVVLDVSKRASDKSGITRNANMIIYNSDGVIEDLKDYPDFRIIQETNPEQIVGLINRIISYHTGKGSADGFVPLTAKDSDGKLLVGTDLDPYDIQIITPINKQLWGTVALNKLTHDVFNPKKSHEPVMTFLRTKDELIEYRMGDRVMHIRANQSERTRLIHHGGNSFSCLKDENQSAVTGINNGEVGKIIGFFEATKLNFDFEDRDKYKKHLKKEFRGNENNLFIGVSYTDVDTDTLDPIEFVILYRTEIVRHTPHQIDVISKDLQYLDLANASTVHKLQGSQAKLCICVFLPVGWDFISRNMIYTSPTRATQGVYKIGDILGRNSAVNRGRRIEQTSRRETIIDLI